MDGPCPVPCTGRESPNHALPRYRAATHHSPSFSRREGVGEGRRPCAEGCLSDWTLADPCGSTRTVEYRTTEWRTVGSVDPSGLLVPEDITAIRPRTISEDYCNSPDLGSRYSDKQIGYPVYIVSGLTTTKKRKLGSKGRKKTSAPPQIWMVSIAWFSNIRCGPISETFPRLLGVAHQNSCLPS